MDDDGPCSRIPTLTGMTLTQPLLRITGVAEALGLIPHLLGFHPEESLVVLVMKEGRVQVTARIDLEPMAEPLACADLLSRLWARYPGAGAWFIAYAADAGLAWRVLDTCAAHTTGIGQFRVVHVDGARWWADTPHAAPGRHDPTCTRLAAEATVLGLPARPSRQALAETLAGPADADLESLVDIASRLEEVLSGWTLRRRRQALRRLIAEFAEGVTLSDDQCVELSLLVQDPAVRDEALLAITRSEADRHVCGWTQVVRRSLLPLQAFPLGLLGISAWVTGNGALQMICLERASRLAPECGLVRIMSDLNEMVLPPEAWDDLRSALLAESRRRR